MFYMRYIHDFTPRRYSLPPIKIASILRPLASILTAVFLFRIPTPNELRTRFFRKLLHSNDLYLVILSINKIVAIDVPKTTKLSEF